ncbi:hypothetical protein [Leeuwenhoekiella sp. MAR_2009_132]|uniref:hypothetical protein n=1 Tax=Leeuwenhoekiella sp. MAR_2009_132 TaxID=1392489 RepID=UPI00068A32DD|nr:hypothetical protein [Leeuwenhoekiella sp. MAR_2009_132]
MKTKKLIFSLILGIIFSNSYSQISASFYQNESNSKIAIGYEFNDTLWTDFRLYSGTNIENITPEIVLNYNLVKKEKYETYIGAGIVLNNINGIVIPIGIGIKPFESLKNLSFNIELNPLYEIDFEDVFIRGFIGIRYVVK